MLLNGRGVNFENTSRPYTRNENWVQNLILRLRIGVQDDAWWCERISDCIRFGPARSSLHLAVFVEPYLSLLVGGTKTIESRFSLEPIAPFNMIWPEDLVLLKRAGGNVVGIGHVGDVKYLKRSDSSWNSLRQNYAKELCVMDDNFWDRASHAWFASLIWFDHLKRLPEIECDKQDRRGWVVVRPATDQLALEFK
jgi:hypothetical protein